MATPNDPVPNTVQVRLLWGTTSQQLSVNVIHFLNTGAVAINQALADQLMTQIGGYLSSSGLGATLASVFGLRQVGVRNIAIANQAEFLSAGAGVLGIDVGEPLPYGVALCVTTRTANAGKSFRGRVYLSGFAESHSSGNIADTAAVNAANAFVDLIRTGLGSAPNLDMAVVSRYEKKALRPIPISTEVTTVQVRNAAWDSQRRRYKPGGTGALLAQFPAIVQMAPPES